MEFVNLNGKILAAEQAVISADNHAYRYGDGLFETMKIKNGKILLAALHFERLWTGLSVLKFEIPRSITMKGLEEELLKLCKKNNCEEGARVRLSVSRGNGGLFDGDEKFQWLAECWPLPSLADELNENGLVIDIFPGARKSCDDFSNLKSANHLPYVMAALFAKENKWNECLLLNTHERICDGTTTNIFWIKNEEVFTPPLSEGCIAGVMRKFLLERIQGTSKRLQGTRYKAQERLMTEDDLEDADEVFLTNAIQGIRWVKQFRGKNYTNKISKTLFSEFLNLLYEK